MRPTFLASCYQEDLGSASTLFVDVQSSCLQVALASRLEAMADACYLHCIKEDGSRGEVAYDLSALFSDAVPAAGQRRIGIGRIQPISPVEGVPMQCEVVCSRLHAKLSVNSRTLLLTDGAGIDGTYVNDIRLPAHTPTPVHNGDIVSFGGGRILQVLVCVACIARSPE